MQDGNEYTQRRIGRVKIATQFLESLPQDAYREMEKHFFALRTDHNVLLETIELTCSSEMFERVPLAGEIPLYEVKVIEFTADSEVVPAYSFSVEKAEQVGDS